MKYPLFGSIVLVLAVIAVYGASLGNGYVDVDDGGLFSVERFSDAWTQGDPELYTPVTTLTFWLQKGLGVDSALMSHAVSMGLHAINVFLVWWLLSLLLFAGSIDRTLVSRVRFFAFLCALLFAVHPQNTEAVAWATARKDLLGALFAFSSLIAFLRKRKGSSHVLFVLGLLSKPSVVVLPVLLLVLDWVQGKKMTLGRVSEKWTYWLLSAAFLLVALVLKVSRVIGLTILDRMLLAVKAAALTLGKFVYPVPVSFVYHQSSSITLASPEFFVPMVVIALLLLCGALVRQRFPEVLQGLLFFTVALSPSFFAFLKFRGVFVTSDRYAYVASVGLLFLLGSLFLRVGRDRAVTVGVLAVALWFGSLAHIHSLDWRDTEMLHRSTVTAHPNSYGALVNLGAYYLGSGEAEKALQPLEHAVTLYPQKSEAYANLGAAYGRLERYEEGVAALLKSLELDPNKVEVRTMLDAAIFPSASQR